MHHNVYHLTSFFLSLFLFLSPQVFGKCCSCVFVFTNNAGSDCHNPHTTITHLLISWPSPTSLFYSSISPSSPLHNNQAFPFSTAVDSETSESRDEDRHVLKSDDLEGKSQNSNGKLPLSDVTNSNLVHQLDSSKRHGVKKEQQTQLHSLKFDAFLTPEHQPFQTSWSTVFYTPDNHVDNSTHTPLSKRGCYVCRLSPTASIAALAVNSKDASNTAVVFFSPLVDAGMSAPLYLSKTKDKTGRYIICVLESSIGQSFRIVNLGGTIPVSVHVHVCLYIIWYLHGILC